MKYYILRQDHRISVYPKIQQSVAQRVWEGTSAMYCETVYQSQFGYCALPLMTRPCFIISSELKRIFEFYQIGSKSRLVAINKPDGGVLFYYFYQPPILDCVSENTQYHPDGTVKQLKLSGNKIGPHKVFQPAWLLENYLIVDMEILELMLAESIYPFLFEELEINE